MSAEQDLQNRTNFLQQEWIKWYNAQLLKEWDIVERKFKNSEWKVVRVVSWELLEIFVDFNWNQKWFIKCIKIEWYEDELFNPKKFRKVNND